MRRDCRGSSTQQLICGPTDVPFGPAICPLAKGSLRPARSLGPVALSAALMLAAATGGWSDARPAPAPKRRTVGRRPSGRLSLGDDANLRWLTQAGSTKSALVRATARAAVSERAVDGDRWHCANPELLGALCDCGVVHVEDCDIARWACKSVHKRDGLVTCGASCAKDFDFPFRGHGS